MVESRGEAVDGVTADENESSDRCPRPGCWRRILGQMNRTINKVVKYVQLRPVDG